MNILSILNWASLIGFYALVIWFFYSHRKNVQSQWHIFFMYRTQRGIKFIKNLAEKARNFWKIYGYLAIPTGFVGMIVILGVLVSSVIKLFINPETAAPAASLVVPWGSTGMHGAVITVSIWYFIIAVGVTVLVHEGAHAVVAATHKIKLLSAGVGILAILPFAFVEPDEKQVEKSKTRTKISIFAAGPFTNILLSMMVFFVVTSLVLPVVANNMEINGLEVTEVNASMPAGLAGLEVGDKIIQVNEQSFEKTTPLPAGLAFSYKGALKAPWPEIQPNQKVTIKTEGGKELTMTAKSVPTRLTWIGKLLGYEAKPRGVLGINRMNVITEPKNRGYAFFFGLLYNLLAWITIFNLGIGLFNLLPIGPLDGGRMVKSLSERLFKKKGARVFGLVSKLSLVILLLGIFGVYILKLF